MRQHQGCSLVIATAYFNIGSWQLLRQGLTNLGNVRLLLSDEPEASLEPGLREAGTNFNEQTLRTVEDLIAFLHQNNMQVRLYTHGFLHAKCYLFYSGGFAHFLPLAALS